MGQSTHWVTVTDSPYPWERDALDFVRDRWPDHDPYRAWANFEFIALDGSINEVDLLVVTPMGVFLIEIKSRPGRVFGHAGAWTWETDGKQRTVANPLMSANMKAKKLRQLLERQKAAKAKAPLPFVEPLVFLSASDLRCELQDTAAFGVCLRDVPASGAAAERPGILAAVKRRACPGLRPKDGPTVDRPLAKTLTQAVEQAGIPSQPRQRRVSDYLLERLLGEGPGYQDWEATHAQNVGGMRRVRLYHVRNGATAAERDMIERAAYRDYRLTETLNHPGVLRAHAFTQHEVGSAIIFEYDRQALRLDHYLTQHAGRLPPDRRLDFLRQLGEVVRFSHEKKVLHRALCPQNVLVHDPDGAHPRLKVFNWQVGSRQAGSSSGGTDAITATLHVEQLVEDAGTAYMAPEAVSTSDGGEHLDVFSLGAVAYHLFSGVPPAANRLGVAEKLRTTRGLLLSDAMNAVTPTLQALVQLSTHPDVASRMDTAADFLQALDEVEDELTAPTEEEVADPVLANKGDRLRGGFTVRRRLGKGGTAVALLVERDGGEFVLKVPNSEENDARLRAEGEVLQKLRHQHVVEHVETLNLDGRPALLLRSAGPETLGDRLRKEGRLHLDMLPRFGEDLLEIVAFLEEQGIPHRDIKPDNIGVGPVGRGDSLHLTLFDFSLSRAPPDNVEAGTRAYLDPGLPARKRWDLAAERYAAAVTLFEMTTGTLPRWGDGRSEPSQLTCEATVDAELFDTALREALVPFFQKALRRDARERHDNAEDMLRDWRDCFAAVAVHAEAELNLDALRVRLGEATMDTSVHELELGTRATTALDRANIMTVEDLLATPMRRLLRLRGVGNKTRREIAAAVKILRERLGAPAADAVPVPDEAEERDATDPTRLSVDLLVARLTKTSAKEGATVRQAVSALLGLEEALADPWPSQAEVGRLLSVTRARVGQVLGKVADRWARDKALTPLRTDVVTLLSAAGGVMTAGELGDAILSARGSVADGPVRGRVGRAVARAAVEAERGGKEPRFQVRRDAARVFVALHPALADYAARLGDAADTLARHDPLAAPTRALQTLREVPAPPGFEPLTDARLLRLATAAATVAAVSSRQELYPRGMGALRALKLAASALGGVKELTVEQVQDRVAGRYPDAEPLPHRPSLDKLLAQAGIELRWEPSACKGLGAYVSTVSATDTLTSASVSPRRSSHQSDAVLTPAEADRRQFEEKLRRSLQNGAFLTLLTPPRAYANTLRRLTETFQLQVMDGDRLFLDALRTAATQAKVDWSVVLRTDAAPGSADWNRLLMLVGRAVPTVEKELTTAGSTVLLLHAGLFARYDRLDVLETLRDKVGRPGGPPGLWLLLPNSQPLIDGKAVPLLSPAQRVHVPESWSAASPERKP